MGFFLNCKRTRSQLETPLNDTQRLAIVNSMLHGDEDAIRKGACQLIEHREEALLFELLKCPKGTVAEVAENALWELWHSEAGPEAQETLERGMRLLSAGKYCNAMEAFHCLMHAHPQWIEPTYKAATVLYFSGRLEPCLRLNKKVLAQKPNHIGAWHGLAMCALQLGLVEEARSAIDTILVIQPHSPCKGDLIGFLETLTDPD